LSIEFLHLIVRAGFLIYKINVQTELTFDKLNFAIGHCGFADFTKKKSNKKNLE